METKEKRKRLAGVSKNIEEIDVTRDYITTFLKMLVDDNVISSVSEIVFAWNPVQDTKIGMMLPLVRPTGPMPQSPDEEVPVEVMGAQLSFITPAKPEEIYISSISLDNTMLIRVLEKIKIDLRLRQKELESEFSELAK